MQKGYVQVYTGDGKGKTTAALGLALRAAGHGLKSYIAQFMKGQRYGELDALAALPAIQLEQFGGPRCLRREELGAEDAARAQQGLARAREQMLSGQYDLVILDEVNVALWFGLLQLDEVLDLLQVRPAGVELVLTGRRAPAELCARSDLVTEMREVKHYHALGVMARAGIER